MKMFFLSGTAVELTLVIIGRLLLSLQVGLDPAVLLVEICHVGDQIFHNIHMWKWVDLHHATVYWHTTETCLRGKADGSMEAIRGGVASICSHALRHIPTRCAVSRVLTRVFTPSTFIAQDPQIPIYVK